MARLAKQKSRMPTRKMWAGILSGVIVGAAQGGVSAAFPDADWQTLLSDLGPWLTALIMSGAGYMIKEREA